MGLSTNEARLALAGIWAGKYALNPCLVCAVIEQESFWNPFAVRFEPAFEARYIHPALPAAPTTLELTKAMSFGLMQIMGQTAIEFGWRGVFLTDLCDPDIGVDFGCRKLRKCIDAHAHAADALLAYNGGGNPLYAHEVLARMGKYEALSSPPSPEEPSK